MRLTICHHYAIKNESQYDSCEEYMYSTNTNRSIYDSNCMTHNIGIFLNNLPKKKLITF